MKKTIARFLSITFAAMLFAQVSVNFDEDDPPFMYAENTEAAGLHPLLFREAFARMGISVTFKAMPWKRVLAELDSGRSGAGGVYVSAERLMKYDYSAPYFDERLVIYALKDKPVHFEKVGDLYGLTVGVRRGWSYGTAFDVAVGQGKILTIEQDRDDGNFRLLALGRVDAVIAVWESGDANITAARLDDKIIRLPNVLTTSKVYLTFSKSAKMKETLAKFDSAIASMKKDGTFDKIVKTALQKYSRLQRCPARPQ